MPGWPICCGLTGEAMLIIPGLPWCPGCCPPNMSPPGPPPCTRSTISYASRLDMLGQVHSGLILGANCLPQVMGIASSMHVIDCNIACGTTSSRLHDRVDILAWQRQSHRQAPPINTCAGMPIGPERLLRLAPNRSASCGAEEACACLAGPVGGAALVLWPIVPSERPPKMSLAPAVLPC